MEEHMKIILTLNSHGRRYMAEDRGAKRKGVDLLAQIASEPISYQYLPIAWRIRDLEVPPIEDLRLDCLFFHLSENPSLCE